jgi:hypothetical protein
MKRRIEKMELEEPYGAIVATKDGLEVEVKAQGFFAGYANTWLGMKKDAQRLAETVKCPRLTEGEKTEGEPPLRLVQED